MGLFKGKQPAKPQPDDAVAEADAVFDEQYRQELRQLGRDHLKSLIDANAEVLPSEIEATVQQVSGDIREYMTSQLDAALARINSEVSNQLSERINDYSRLASESQELASQSLTRNSQAVFEKYQQLSATLQQTIASQEVQMIAVFQESKNRLVATQAEQDEALATLRDMTESARRQTDQLHQEMKQAISSQSAQLSEVYQKNLTEVTKARQAQASALETLQAGAEALEEKHRQLAELLDKSVADQKAMLVETVNDNMARIIEHYLVGALGEQSDLKAQLPSIVERLEQSKQAMMDDMML